jgi:hypothetical protein
MPMGEKGECQDSGSTREHRFRAGSLDVDKIASQRLFLANASCDDFSNARTPQDRDS